MERQWGGGFNLKNDEQSKIQKYAFDLLLAVFIHIKGLELIWKIYLSSDFFHTIKIICQKKDRTLYRQTEQLEQTWVTLSLVSSKSKALSHAVTLITGYDLNA